MRACAFCGDVVDGHANRRYCNSECRDNAADEIRRERAETYTCSGCGGIFTREQPSATGLCLPCSRPRGSRNPNYNGGLCFNRALGRWQIMCRDGSRVYYYRAVMEAHLGRPLKVEEQVHHINGDPCDDRPENLQLMACDEHSRLHAHLRRSAA